jgi:hypothetical protein
MYSLGTWFVSGIYVQIPCRKELNIIIIIIIITLHAFIGVKPANVFHVHPVSFSRK